MCGCDGKVYDNECAAQAAGADLAVMGGCKQGIVDWAPCGKQYCNARTHYCEILLSDVFELPTDYFCRPLPSTCLPQGNTAKNCDCFAAGRDAWASAGRCTPQEFGPFT